MRARSHFFKCDLIRDEQQTDQVWRGQEVQFPFLLKRLHKEWDERHPTSQCKSPETPRPESDHSPPDP